MSFRLVPKLATLNDLERRDGPYFALFHRIRVRCRRKKVHFAISSPDEFLVVIARCLVGSMWQTKLATSQLLGAQNIVYRIVS